MNYQYKVIVSNRTVYKEFEINSEMKRVKLGTHSTCEFRLNPDLFFSDIDIEFHEKNGVWSVDCYDNVYLSCGDMRKLYSTELKHGDIFNVCYMTGNTAFEIHFLIDFEAKVPNYNWYIDLNGQKIVTLGDAKNNAKNNDIILKTDFNKNSRIEIVCSGNEWIIREIKTQFGIYINGAKISKEVLLNDFDFISISDASFFFKDNKLYFDNKIVYVETYPVKEVVKKTNSLEYPLFNRSTRVKSIISNDAIEVLDPPSPPSKPEENLVQTLLPALLMLALTVVVRGFMSKSSNSSFIIFSVCSMAMGIGTSIASYFQSRKKYKADCERRVTKYGNYINNKRTEISNKRNEEREILEALYLNSSVEVDLVDQFSERLFERQKTDEDYLHLYLGTGHLEAKQKIKVKEQEHFETEDELADIPVKIAEEFKYIEDAPIVVSLKDSNAIGVVGTEAQRKCLFRNFVLDLVSRQFYGDLKLYAIIGDDYIQFEWLKDIPHFQSVSGMRNIVFDNDSRGNVFESLYRELTIRSEANTKEVSFQSIVVLVLEERGLKNHPLSKFIENAVQLNCSFIFFENSREELPLCCKSIIQIEDDDNALLIDSQDFSDTTTIKLEHIDDDTMKKVALKLAPIFCQEISLESSLRKNITLFELLGIYAVNDWNLGEKWRNSQIYNTMAVPLGINAKNEVVYLNLHEKFHGPHGLVAGTTGSGKSEILQSYILSAALLFHPYEIAFVIIDFKGGGMVNQFRDLPHLVGAITNIDGREIDRSLKSIKAELIKRQALFAEANVNHIDKYIRLFKEGRVSVPLPHLVIIVDEFAELKAEQPEFMKELISAARIGRSLGVHLILATQKPAGQVNEQIWSNSKFKLCLKVQNQEDSKEVLKSPLAAEIREPGRAYLQVGNNEIFELFQSAYSGAPSTIDASSMQKAYKLYKVAFSGKKQIVFEQKKQVTEKNSTTELEAIVEYISGYCKENGIVQLPGICLPSLKDVIMYDSAKAEKDLSNTVIDIGIYDDPDSQLQANYALDIQSANTLVIGTSQVGKTSLLQLVIRDISEKYSPKDVNIYIMDLASKALKIFEDLNHVGGVITDVDDEKMKHFVRMISIEIDKRKETFSHMGITSYNSYREAGMTDISHIVILVDNFGALKDVFPDYEDDFLTFLREGNAVGISVIATSKQTSSIGYRYMSNFGNRICYTCNDSSEYSNVFDRCRMEMKNVPGRGLMTKDKRIFEFQTYLAFSGEKEIDRVESIKNYIFQKNAIYSGVHARRIPSVPKKLDRQKLKEMFSEQSQRYVLPMGINYENVSQWNIDLTKIGVLFVSGAERRGRSNFIKAVVNELQSRVFSDPCEVTIFDGYERKYSSLGDMGIVSKYSVDFTEIENHISQVESVLEMRQEQLRCGAIESVKDEPLLLTIINSEEFWNGAYSKTATEQFKKVVKLGKTMKAAFIVCNVENTTIGFSSGEMLKFVKENKNVLFFDNLSNMKMLDVTAAQLRIFKKAIDVGDAYFIKEQEIEKIKTVLAE